MNFRILKFFSCLFNVFIIGIQGIAQPVDSLYQLDEVIIVSDRLGHSEERTGRHISIIRSSEILSLPVNSIDELLRYVPFMEIQSRGPFGAQSDILMRGSTFNQSLVLIDGMRINDPLTGHFNSNIPVAVTEISRIEIYRGAASSIYGPDAVGGVINIITKSFEAGQQDERINGRLEAWYGQHNLKRTNSGLNISKGKWDAAAGLSYHSSDGQPLDSNSLKGDFNIMTASASIAGMLTENINLAFRTALDNRRFNARYFYTNSPLDLSREEVQKWWNQAKLNIRAGDSHAVTLSAGYQSTRDSFLFNPMFPANVHTTSFQNYQLNHQYLPDTGFRFASGIQLDNRSILSMDRGDHSHWHGGAYVAFSKEFIEYVTVGTGLRLDYDRIYGLEVLPQVNFSYARKKLNLRGSAGRSIRSPDFTENYISTGLDGPLSPGRNLGNPDLFAEQAWSIEAGAGYGLINNIKLNVTGFYRSGRNLIDYVMTASEDIPVNKNLVPQELYFFARNIGRVNTGGLESGLQGNHHILSDDWSIDWNISWQVLFSEGEQEIISKYLASHSRNLVNAILRLSADNFRFQFSGMFKDRNSEIANEINAELEGSYMLVNTRLDKYFWNERLQLSLQVYNIMDRSYSDIMGAKMPGRWIQGGITWNFERAL